jgi:hypothetical protein
MIYNNLEDKSEVLAIDSRELLREMRVLLQEATLAANSVGDS